MLCQLDTTAHCRQEFFSLAKTAYSVKACAQTHLPSCVTTARSGHAPLVQMSQRNARPALPHINPTTHRTLLSQTTLLQPQSRVESAKTLRLLSGFTLKFLVLKLASRSQLLQPGAHFDNTARQAMGGFVSLRYLSALSA
jgi:hypothetical protein